MHTIRKLARVLLVLVPLACGGGDEEATQAAPDVPSGAADTATSADGCPETGLWQQCNVEKRIERAGLVATAMPDTARKDFLAVPGLRYDLGRGELQLYLYADSVARKRDTDRLDPERAAPPGQGGGWSTRARLITSNNMAAVLLTTNETLAERVGLALGAGLPR